MMNSLELGCAPSEEAFPQLGDEGYREKAMKSCQEYRNQLRRSFGGEPTGCKLIIESHPHEFGTYYEVTVMYSETPDCVDYAFNCEGRGPAYWDEEACKALGIEWKEIDRRQ